jgi:hypothetical protein
MQSAWYQSRLAARSGRESAHRQRRFASLQEALANPGLPQNVRLELERRFAAFSR